jgi:hypothetical protein
MLSPAEKKALKNRDDLKPRVRANLDYRIAQKLKKSLSDLDDIDQALRSIPEKNARRVLDDQMVAAIFRLTENMIRILGYVPVEEGDASARYVEKKELVSRYIDSEKFEVIRKAPTAEDEARHLLLEEHIERLQEFANPKIRARAQSEVNVHPGFNNNKAFSDGYNLCRKWQEPK